MRVIVKGKNVELTDALKEHARQKVAKIEKLGLGFKEIEVKLVVEKNPSIKDHNLAELTVKGDGPLLRATDRDPDMYVAIDKAVDKLQRRIKKFHGKRVDRSHRLRDVTMEGRAPEAGEASPSIVKTKTVALKPMSAEEAALQMEMLGHDFFIFMDADTGNSSVVYRRKDGNYGLIDVVS